MEIIGHLATNLSPAEKAIFAIEDNEVFVAQLSCSQVLDQLIEKHAGLRAAQEMLPANAHVIVPYSARSINIYTSQLSRVRHDIRLAINIGAKVLVYESELALGA